MKEKSINFKLHRIIQLSYSFSTLTKIKSVLKDEELKFSISTSNPIFPKDKRIGIGLKIEYLYMNEKKEESKIVQFENLTLFDIENYNEIVIIDNGHTAIPNPVLHTLFSIAYSTARGILAEKLAGTYLGKHYLPLIDPSYFYPLGPNSKSMEKEE